MPKRIIDESFSRSYWFLRLDRRDLEQVFDTIGAPATLSSEGYEYASVAELAEHFGSRRPKEIEIRGRVRVTIAPSYSSLSTSYAASDNDKKQSIALAVSVDALLKQRTRMSLTTWIAAYVVAAGAGLLSYLAWTAGRGSAFLAAWLLLLLLCVWLYFLKGSVTLTAAHEPFVRRHQEAIVASIVSVVLTLCGTALYDWLKSR